MAGSNAVVVKFIADTRAMSKGIDKVNTQLGGFSKAMKGVGIAVAGAFAASKVADFGKEIVSLASEMEQVAGTADTLFGPDAAKQIAEWAKTAAESLGLSERAATSAANTFSIAGKSIGLSGDDLVGFTTDLVGVAADLGAVAGTTEEAVSAMASALRGEFDPLERFGIQLNATTLQAYAFDKGITQAYNTLDNATKQGLIASYIEEQTAALGITGQFARESETFAVKLQELSAKWENLQVAVGEKLLPALTALLDVIIDVVDAFSNLGDFLDRNREIIEDVAIAVGVLTIAIIANKVAMAGAAITSGIYSAAVLGLVGIINLATKAQIALNTAVRANPYVLVATAIAAYIIWVKRLTGELNKQVKAEDNLVDVMEKHFDSWEKFVFFAPNAAAVAFAEINKSWKNLTDSWETESEKQRKAAEAAAWKTEGHWSDASGNIVGSTYTTTQYIVDAYNEAARYVGNAAQASADAWAAGQNSYTSALSGTISSAIASAGREDAAKGLNSSWNDIISKPLEEAFKSGGSRGGSAAREEAEEELKKIGKGYTANLTNIDLYVGKRVQKVSADLQTEYVARLNALKGAATNYEQVVNESTERVLKKMEDAKKQISETFLGFNLDDFVKVQDDGTTIFDSEAFDAYFTDKQKLADRLAPLVGNLDPLWIQQLSAMGTDAANATLNYLLGVDANGTPNWTNDNKKFQDLATYVEDNLGTPYADAMKNVYWEAEGEGIKAAKARVEEEKESFKEWSKKKLKHTIPVSVVYQADYSQAGPAARSGSIGSSYTIKSIQDYERMNGSKWRSRVR